VDDLCKKAASLGAGREMLGIIAAARTHFGPVTWENIMHTLCIKENRGFPHDAPQWRSNRPNVYRKFIRP
jgi:hypothetical protein